ncbi:MAG: hypothetical protein ACI4E3_00700 [Candidatus Fimousia sp.]
MGFCRDKNKAKEELEYLYDLKVCANILDVSTIMAAMSEMIDVNGRKKYYSKKIGKQT